MPNEIVKFSNQFNNVTLHRFDATHLDVLMSIAARVKEQGTDEITLTYTELRHLMRLRKNLTNRELTDKIIGMNRRLLNLNYEFQTDGRIIQFALFTVFETSPRDQTLTVGVNRRFAFLLNELTSQFTRFELAEFTGLRSKYAKEFYRRAKQYRATGVWTVSRVEFCRLLDVPAATAASTTNLNKKVLRPILGEVGPLLSLTVVRRYGRRPGQRGRGTLTGFTFMFAPTPPPVPEDTPPAPSKTSKPSLRNLQPYVSDVAERLAEPPVDYPAFKRFCVRMCRDGVSVADAADMWTRER